MLSIIPIYIAVLGILFIPITMRAGLYRAKSNISIGTGDDPELLRRVRGQGNFVETVPIALLLLIVMELMGATNVWLHTLGGTLVVGRIAHYLGLTELGPSGLRAIGMIATLLVILISAVWVLIMLV